MNVTYRPALDDAMPIHTVFCLKSKQHFTTLNNVEVVNQWTFLSNPLQ